MPPLAILSLAFNHQSSAGELDYIPAGENPGLQHRSTGLDSRLRENDGMA
jgi:hypothetical protein